MDKTQSYKKTKKTPLYFSIIGLFLIFIFVNCEQPFSVSDLLDGPDGLELTLSPSSAQIVTNDVITFKASGGVPPYTYYLSSRIDEPGEALVLGTYTSPSTTGNAEISVKDSYGAVASASVEVISAAGNGVLNISPSFISINGGNSVTLVASGGSGSYSYTLETPIGGTGEDLTGSKYTAPSDVEATATVRVTDTLLFDISDAEISVSISGSSALKVSPSTVTLNLSDSIELTASGGTGPYNYSFDTSLGGTGEDLTGNIYTAPSDKIGTAKVLVTDDNSDSVVSTITITPSSALAIRPVALSVNTGGSFTFSAYGGVPPYSFSIETPGSGTPSIDSVTGAYLAGNTPETDTIRVTDNDGVFEEAEVTVTDLSTEVNYDSVTVNNTGGMAGGSAITGNFTFTNNGTGNGSKAVNWEVYVSFDTIIGSGDSIIDSGTTGALNKGITTPVPIEFTGIWPVPVSDTTYYIIVKISAVDDFITADNEGNTSALITAPVSADIDYIVESISNSPSTADVSTPIAQSFILKNQGGDPGASPVSWTAYISEDDIWDGGDTPASSGSVSAPGASPATLTIDITNNWPASAGVYYLIVNISAGDDIDPFNNYLSSDPFTINATGTDIDYKVSNISRDYPTVSAGSLCSETFDLTNIGGGDGVDDGGDEITWIAYASTHISLGVGTDTPIDSGTLDSLDAGFGYSSVLISGSWPSASGEYYIIIEVSCPDEDITGNNISYNGLFTVIDPPDYSITSTNFLTTGTSEEILSNDAEDYEFYITNSGADGTQQILWEVFASSGNSGLDETDTRIKFEIISPLSAGQTIGPISFSEVFWPADMNFLSFIIIKVSSADDINQLNNTTASPSIWF